MNLIDIERALDRGRPFVLKVADGDEFHVDHPDYLLLPDGPGPGPKNRSSVTFYDYKTGYTYLLPLLTITSLRFREESQFGISDSDLEQSKT